MSNHSKRRTWVILVGIAVLLGAGIPAGRLILLRAKEAPSLSVETVERRDIAVTIEATGVVEPVDLVEVKSKASGQILRMPVQVGSVVRAGDLLAQIDTVDVQNQYEQAAAAARAAQARVDVSTAALERADDLFAQKIITVGEHESAGLDYANAEAALIKARTDLDSARQRRDDATVRAPVAGTILEQPVVAGQVIASATSSVTGGTVLLRMADLSRIRLRTLVAETDIGSVRSGQTANVSVEAFPQRTFQGAVEKIEPQAVVQQSVTMFPVLVSISNQDGLLLPGMNGEVSVQVDRQDNVLAVPLDAVRTVRELPTVAAALNMSADSVSAQIARRFGSRPGSTPGRSGGRADSSRVHGRGWRGGEARAGNGTGGGRGTRQGGGSRGAGAGLEGAGAGSDSAGTRGGGLAEFGAGNGTGRAGRTAQAVVVKTPRGLEARVVRLGLSDFDYAQVLGGLEEGEQVVLLGVLEQQAKRTADQAQIRARLGTGLPGTTGGGARTSPGGR